MNAFCFTFHIRILVLLSLMAVSNLFSQTVSDYSYQWNDGKKIVMEKAWNRVDIATLFDSINDESGSVEVSITPVGSLFTTASWKLTSAGAEIDPGVVQPGSYVVKCKAGLMNGYGHIGFSVQPVMVKKHMRTRLLLQVYDYELFITSKKKPSGGLCYYQADIFRGGQQNGVAVYPVFYQWGNHAVKINPDEPMGDYYGKIKSGKYNLLCKIELNMTGYTHKVWIENFQMNPDSSYEIKWNLNASEIKYIGGNYEVKQILLYPSGTAEKQNGKAVRQKSLEILAIERPSSTTLCPPGHYDILLDYGFGVKYEWRKDIHCDVSKLTEVK